MDISLYYQEKGQGIPFVLLHGNGESGEYFKKQIEYFSNQYRMITVDTRGHGKSPRGTAPFTMDQFAEDLNAFLEEKNINNIILLGFSDGANIAIKFALKHQDKIRALILNGADLDTKGVKRSVQIPIEIAYRISRLFQNKSEEAKLKTEILGLMVNEPNIKTEELHSIKVPTLVIVGSKDLIKEKHSRLIADSIKGSELSIVEGNHFIAGKNPTGFNKEIEKFLSKTIK
ncbi:MAG: alpha/beta hydrolase [Clostridia bacterium]|nr:alpha/beta hydrolase [Clostridia bacterium]